MKIGVVVKLDDNNIDARFKQVKDYGFDCCQLIGWKFELFTDEIAEMVIAACRKYGVTISTFWCGRSYSVGICGKCSSGSICSINCIKSYSSKRYGSRKN